MGEMIKDDEVLSWWVSDYREKESARLRQEDIEFMSSLDFTG